MSTDATITKDLMQTLEDGREGFADASEKLADTDRADLAPRFLDFSEQRGAMSAELEVLAARYGDDIDADSSVAGSIHRGWMSVKDALTGSSASGILDAAEQGEDRAVSEYNKALGEDLSAELADVVRRQLVDITAVHDEVRRLRDATT